MSDVPDDPDDEAGAFGSPDVDDTYEEFLRLQRGTFEHDLPDWMLGAWVEIAAEYGLEFSLMLCVRGVIVSGLLVSEARFLTLTAERIEEKIGSKEAALLAGPFRMIAERSTESATLRRLADPSRDIGPDDPQPDHLTALRAGPSSIRPLYIHLRDAVLLSGPRSVQIGQWRGRLSDVSAWSVSAVGNGVEHPLE